MPSDKDIDNRSHIHGFQEEISKMRKASKETFFTWFNNDKDLDESFIRGSWDFIYYILYPTIKHLNYVENKTILEIGYGGGRMLAAATRFFKNAIGIDIHDENDYVLEEFKRRGINNVNLFKSNGKSLPIVNNSVDLVYSFIVFQHIEKIEIFKQYLKETYRVLKDNGIAVLYFGRVYKFSFNKNSKMSYFLDRIYENLKLKDGYVEIPAKINETNLKVSLSYAKKTTKKLGFQILKVLTSRRKIPDEINFYGRQYGLVLRKIKKKKKSSVNI